MSRLALIVAYPLLIGAIFFFSNMVSADESIKIENVTNHEGVKGLRATFQLNAPREAIWNLLTDYERFRETFKRIRDLQVLNENEKGSLVRFKIREASFSFQYTLQRNYKRPNELLTWHRTDGSFQHLSGRWEILPGTHKDAHKVIYESFVDVGFFIPTSLVRYLAAKELKKMVSRMRSRLVHD